MDVMDTLRLFIDCIDFSDPKGHGWDALFLIYHHNYSSIGDGGASLELLLWLLQQSSCHLRTNFIAEKYAETLNRMCHVKDAASLFLEIGPERAIDTVDKPYGYSMLMWRIAYGKDLTDMAPFGPNLHLLGFDRAFSPCLETPTSLAIYSSAAFAHWREFLIKSNVDIDEFVSHETKQGPLQEAGWNSHNLRRLFDLKFMPAFHVQDIWSCCDCGDPIWRLRVQPYWLWSIETIQQGNNLRILDNKKARAAQDPSTNGSLPLKNPRPDQFCTRATAIPTSETASDEGRREVMAKSNCTLEVCRRYEPDDIVCIDCWLFQHRTGFRRVPSTADDTTSDLDEISDSSSTEDEYSPFLIHT